jgi:nickel-dependent lactate racemase
MRHVYDLPYGRSCLAVTLESEVPPLVMLPKARPVLPDPAGAVREALASPLGAAPLLALLRELKKDAQIVVVVNDETRPTPYEFFFPPLLEVFDAAGIRDGQISFLIATGIHDLPSEELNRRIYGAAMTERFRFLSHDAGNDAELRYMGRFASGYDFHVNRLAVEADFLLTLGVVMPHYFAGFSGGRKSVLPGLAGRGTVQLNHARMVELMDNLPPIAENPISLEMIEAARDVGVDFILNAVTDASGGLVAVTAGDLKKAWYKAVEVSSAMFEIPFEREADICLASACGYPRDVNAYQAQKALDHADRITRKGGTIILAAECPGSFGDAVFEKWMRGRMEPEEIMRRIKADFVMGGHKAYGFAKVAAHKHFLLISSMSREDSELLFAAKARDIDEALGIAFARHGKNAAIAVLPQGSLTLPVPARRAA